MGFVLQYDLDANVFGLLTWLQKSFFFSSSSSSSTRLQWKYDFFPKRNKRENRKMIEISTQSLSLKALLGFFRDACQDFFESLLNDYSS